MKKTIPTCNFRNSLKDTTEFDKLLFEFGQNSSSLGYFLEKNLNVKNRDEFHKDFVNGIVENFLDVLIKKYS